MLKENISAPQSWLRAILAISTEIIRSRLWFGLSQEALSTLKVNKDFFAINITSSEDPASDDYVIEALNDLNLKHVRLAFSYESFGSHAQRLLDRVIAEDFRVMLNILPPLNEAKNLDSSVENQQRWKEFVNKVFENYHDKIDIFEIGNTTNRKKWSGFNLITYLTAWDIARPVADQYKLTIAGPNVSDFEPLYNIAYLDAMRRTHNPPKIHTDNLFVERVIEPEAFDHRVSGKYTSRFLKLNLVKKARILDQIGKKFGSTNTFCTYTGWTVRRLSRRNKLPEQKQAEYLTRYLILALASGALVRTYWGPLICGRDGLIDCGSDNNSYPEIDNVAYYKALRGSVENFRRRPAFFAFQNIISSLGNAELVQGFSGENGISHFIFITEDKKEVHVCWCRDNFATPFTDLYPDELQNVEYSHLGITPLNSKPHNIIETPLFIYFSSEKTIRPDLEQLKEIPSLMIKNIVAGVANKKTFHHFENNDWQGALMVDNKHTFDQACAEFIPEALEQAEELKILRDSRNRIWNIPSSLGTLSVKLNRTTGFKRYSYRFQCSKAKRHWNNGTHMLLRGINTPQPIAFFERKEECGVRDSYYVTEFLENAFSSREIFTCINNGEDEYRKINSALLLKEVATFVCKMHNKGILHRDLSSGNILLTCNDENDPKKVTLFLIDIGRARILTTLSKRQRLIDLMRINYKLTWPGREEFMNYYHQALGKELKYWRYAVRFYEWKQKSKRAMKRGIKKLKSK
ncbi:MAG: lipopolysaccharide kinase InaA family protein [Gammaproteobacteria bacterium]